jgi:hypothetical protein
MNLENFSSPMGYLHSKITHIFPHISTKDAFVFSLLHYFNLNLLGILCVHNISIMALTCSER